MKLKLGLIGLGNQMQENLLPALCEIDEAEIYTAYSRDPIKANEIAEKYKIKKVARTTDEVFETCDAIIVSATPEVHLHYIKKATQLGRAIFVEKPPVESLEQYDELRKIIKEKNTPVAFGFNFKYADFYKYLIEQTNDFHNVQFMKIKSYAAKPDAAMWSCSGILESSLLAIHIHAIEMLCYSFNSTTVQIQSDTIWLSDTKFILTILVKFDNGRNGVLELSNISNRFEFDVECASDTEVWRCNDFNKIEYSRNDNDGDTINRKSRVIYEVPFLRGGFERTGYQGELAEFAKRAKKRENNWREINNLRNVYQIIKEVTK